jgi:hypothetical protein
MIVAAAQILLCVLAAQPFELHEYEDVGPDTRLLVYSYSEQAPPAILVYDKTMLKIYDHWNRYTYHAFAIPENTLAFDAIDINDDDILDGIFLLPDRLHVRLSGSDPPHHREIALEKPVDWMSHSPVPTTLVMRHEDQWEFAVHHTDAVYLYAMDGTPLSKVIPSIDTDDTLRPTPVYPPQIASAEGLEFRVDTTWAQSYAYPEQAVRATRQDGDRHLTQRMLQDAESKDPEEWPWFPLQNGADDKTRILVAKAAPDYRNTYVRFRRSEIRHLPAERGPFNFSPKRLYPGNLLLLPTGLPDVNDDGYSDLLFWSIPPPGTSMSGLIRGAQSGKWTIRLTVHLYDPKTGNFQPRPSSRIKMDVPLTWMFLNPGVDPIRNLVFADLDSDGDSDLVCSTDDRTISAWLYDTDYGSKPDFTSRFDEPIELLHWDIPGNEETASMLVRTDTSLYLLTLP